MITTLYLSNSADGLIATSNRITNEESEWSEIAWERWCGHCTASKNLIVGRKTYIELTQYDVSDVLYPEHKIVVSSQDIDLADTWTQFSNPKQAIDFLSSCDIENAIVGGGRQLGLAFVREALIDELVLDIYPILFGGGTQLLGELDKCLQLELVSTEEFEDGAVRIQYKLLNE